MVVVHDSKGIVNQRKLERSTEGGALHEVHIYHGVPGQEEWAGWFSDSRHYRMLVIGSRESPQTEFYRRRQQLIASGMITQEQAKKTFCLSEGWTSLSDDDQQKIMEFLDSKEEFPESPRVATLLDFASPLRELALRTAIEVCASAIAPEGKLRTLLLKDHPFEILAGPVLALGSDLATVRKVVERGFDNLAGWPSLERRLSKLFGSSTQARSRAIEAKAFEQWTDQRRELKHGWLDKLPDQLMRNDGQAVVASGAVSQWHDRIKQLVDWCDSSTAGLGPEQLLESPLFAPWPADLRETVRTWLANIWAESQQYALIRSIQSRFRRTIERIGAALGPALDRGVAVPDPERVANSVENAIQMLEELPSRLEWPSVTLPDLPRVLVVDDELGRINDVDEDGNLVITSEKARSSLQAQREGFCWRFKLIDEEKVSKLDQKDAIARARFVSGQRYERGRFVNDAARISKEIASMGSDCALILMDLRFCEGKCDDFGLSHSVTLFGLEWVEGLQHDTHLPVVIVSAEKTDEIVARVRATHAYLHRYSSGVPELVSQIIRAGRATPRQLRRMMRIPFEFVAESPAMIQMLRDVYDSAQDPTDPTLLLLGGTGSGKSELAKLIHNLSRPRGPWRRLDCSLLTPSLAQSQLFGHYKGAYTGGDSTTPGVFQEAHDGTLFLDEVGKLPEAVQPMLYRAMEGPTSEREATPLRSKRSETDPHLDGRFNVRLIFATNESTASLDRPFLGRIHRTIKVPELWERREDILPLAELFLARLSAGPEVNDQVPEASESGDDNKEEEGSQIERLLTRGRPRLTLDLSAQEFLRAQFGVSGQSDRNIRLLQALLAEASRGMGRINLIRRTDLESAWNSINMKFEYSGDSRGAPAGEAQARISEPVLSAESPLSNAAARLLNAAEAPAGLMGLTISEQDGISGALYGKAIDIIGAIAAFAFLSCPDAKSTGNFLTGENIESSKAQPLLQRLLKLHPRVVSRVRDLVPELARTDKDGGKEVLASLLSKAEEDLRTRQELEPPRARRAPEE